jgi:meromycolic acid enoyl-[acyl-carrier-protein] reductase
MNGLLEGKRLLITGVITEASIAFHTARIAQEEGAQVVLTGFGRMSLVERVASMLPKPAPVLELDVTDREQLRGLPDAVRMHMPALDGVVHAIGSAPQSCFGGDFYSTEWSDVAEALHVSAYSLSALTEACLPLLGPGASIVGLDFDGRVAWSVYNWMGVAKATLEAVSRYLAKDLGPRGIRVNLVASGPIKTMASRAVLKAANANHFSDMQQHWDDYAPLGWAYTDGTPVARSVCGLLSDWFPATTGSIVMADGGVHAIGQAMRSWG